MKPPLTRLARSSTFDSSWGIQRSKLFQKKRPPSSLAVGVIGCSVAYHLSQLGWKDVVLLERKQLTCGTTWHAAGLIGQLRATLNMTKLAQYSAQLYATLEQETDVATGYKQTGICRHRPQPRADGGIQT